MTLAAGRTGTPTDRDREVLLSLFFCRYMSTTQLADLFFPSPRKARSRLARLAKKGYVTNRTMYIVEPTSWEDRASAQGVWHLTKPGFDSVAETLDLEESFTPKQLLPKQARHYVRAAEVYAAVKHRLDAELGDYPGWEWRHERRVPLPRLLRRGRSRRRLRRACPELPRVRRGHRRARPRGPRARLSAERYGLPKSPSPLGALPIHPTSV